MWASCRLKSACTFISVSKSPSNTKHFQCIHMHDCLLFRMIHTQMENFGDQNRSSLLVFSYLYAAWKCRKDNWWVKLYSKFIIVIRSESRLVLSSVYQRWRQPNFYMHFSAKQTRKATQVNVFCSRKCKKFNILLWEVQVSINICRSVLISIRNEFENQRTHVF